MPIGISRARTNLAQRAICDGNLGLQVAEFADDLLVEALDGYVRQESLEALIEQWRAERAELAAQQARFMADIRKEMNEIRKEINEFREESNLRERERDERERQRDERERQRARDQEARDANTRNWVVGTMGIGIAVASVVTGLIVAFG